MDNNVKVIKNISIASALEFLNSEDPSSELNQIIAEKIKASDLKKVSKELVARIVNATNHQVNISILRKDSHVTNVDQMVVFGLADADKVLDLVRESAVTTALKKSSSEGIPKEVENSIVVLQEDNPFVVTPEEVEAAMKDYVRTMVATLPGKREKTKEESIEDAFAEMDNQEDILVKISKVFYGEDYKDWVAAFKIAEDIFGKKHSSDPEENEKIRRKLFNTKKADLENIFEHLRVRMYKKSAEGYYDSEEFLNKIRKFSHWLEQVVTPVVGAAGSGAAKAGFSAFTKYPGEAVSYATFKNLFDIGTRIRAEDLAASTALSTSVSELASAGVQYGLGLMDKFFRSLSNKIKSITQVNERRELIQNILKESRELAINADPTDLAEWYATLIKVAPEMSMDKSFTKGFLLQAATLGQVTPEMLQKAAQLEKTVSETGQFGATEMQIWI